MAPPVSRVKQFTVSTANRTLPLVNAIVGDIVALYRDVAERKSRLDGLKKRRPRSPARDNDPYREELELIQADLARDVDRLQEYVAELNDLGVELKDPAEGLVDFPTSIDGHPAFLCWKLGEADVRFWHTSDTAYTSRQPLPGHPTDHAV